MKVGLRYNGLIEIKEGLNQGEIKLLHSGQIKLSDGTSIAPIEQDTLTLAQSTTRQP